MLKTSRTRGLSGAKEIAKKALSEKVKPEQVIKMLTDNNSAYQELIASSGAEKAQKMIVSKAEAELASPRNDHLTKDNPSKGKNR